MRKARTRVTKRLQTPPADSPDGKGRRVAGRDAVRRGTWQAFRNYEPKPIAAPILLVLSSQNQAVGEGHDWHLRWSEYTQSFDMTALDGRKGDVFQMPNVESLAAILRARTGVRG